MFFFYYYPSFRFKLAYYLARMINKSEKKYYVHSNKL